MSNSSLISHSSSLDCAICFTTFANQDARDDHEQHHHDWSLMHCACCLAAWVPRCCGWRFDGAWIHRCRNGDVGWLAENGRKVCYSSRAMTTYNLENESATSAVDSRLWLAR